MRRPRTIGTVAATLLAVAAGAGVGNAAPRSPLAGFVVTRASVNSDGIEGNDWSTAHPGISADGRFVAFDSYATNLVPNDTNTGTDVFYRDQGLRVTDRATVSSDEVQSDGGDNDDWGPEVSSDGRYIVYDSYATNLVDDDTNGASDIFVRDVVLGTTTRVSVASDGTQGNGESRTPAISADGRFVSFNSAATNLVAGDTNGYMDIFVHDMQTGVTTRVSVSSGGVQGNSISGDFSRLSADGRYVVFNSNASNLVPSDMNHTFDVFVHDMDTGTTERDSVDSAGREANGASDFPTISSDGRYVVFQSRASDLVGSDTNSVNDIFIHDRTTGRTDRVSVTSTGGEANCVPDGEGGCLGGCTEPAVSADARYVAFAATSTNLVPGDTNHQEDVFLRDRRTGQTFRISVSVAGQQVKLGGHSPAISADGKVIAYESFGSNIVPGDTNGTGDIFVFNFR